MDISVAEASGRAERAQALAMLERVRRRQPARPTPRRGPAVHEQIDAYMSVAEQTTAPFTSMRPEPVEKQSNRDLAGSVRPGGDLLI